MLTQTSSMFQQGISQSLAWLGMCGLGAALMEHAPDLSGRPLRGYEMRPNKVLMN